MQNGKLFYFCAAVRVMLIDQNKTWHKHSGKKRSYRLFGEMAEWSIAAVLKTVELRGSGGSNPSLSAHKNQEFFNRI